MMKINDFERRSMFVPLNIYDIRDGSSGEVVIRYAIDHRLV
jgi:hypothetical protein